jgi:8-oxo-dGTP pyrophosphatase MutT (NUDIX family)
MENNGPWKIKKRESRYKNDFMEVFHDEVVQPDGKEGTYGTVHVKNGVAVLPVSGQRQVFLVDQFRYAAGARTIEAAAGGIESEEPQEAARAELKEELGIVADSWHSLGVMDMDTSLVNCRMHLFLAQDLHFTQAQREGTEDIRTVRCSIEEAVEMVMNGKITHSASCVLVLKAGQLLRIKRTGVDSSVVEAAGYNALSRTARIWFKGGKGVYDYFDVPQSDYDPLIGSESIGSYINKVFKKKFTGYRQLDDHMERLVRTRDYFC